MTTLNHLPDAGAAIAAGETRTEPSTRDLIGLVVGFAIIAALDFTVMDRSISKLFGDAGGFALRENWWTTNLLHDKARLVSWAVVALLVVNVWLPLPFARVLSRVERVRWLATTLACIALLPLLKHVSATSCPWSLAEFGGGSARYVSHWAFGHNDGGPGRCFPAGQAVAGFAFLPGYFALRRRAPAAAGWWLTGTLLTGALLGGVQVVRGAHFVSHVLWTGWWCWAMSLAVFSAPALRRQFASSAPLPIVQAGCQPPSTPAAAPH